MEQKGKDRLFWIWLSRRLGAGNSKYSMLLEHFGNPYEVYKAEEEELISALPELTPRECRALSDKDLSEAYEIREYCRRNQYSMLCYDDSNYPLSYRSLTDPPLLLYYRGTLPDFQNRLCIAIVGTRKMSEYGRRIAYKIAYELASAGVIIVSGMALGVDSVAACAALSAGGQTVALLGSGLDVPYPREHTGFQKILEQRGAVLSEYAPGSEPKGYHFPVRNRLISGLCQGTLIIEGPKGSGALITAKTALTQGRDLFAVPANVGDPNAEGVNQLIHDGAHVTLSADDILSKYKMLYRHTVTVKESASLGKRSDYDPEMLARMGVYSRTVDGNDRVSAATLQPPSPAKVSFLQPPPLQPVIFPSDAELPVSYASAYASPRAVASSSLVNKEQKNKKKALTESKAQPCPADHSAETLRSLGDRERAVFEAFPMDQPTSLDRLQTLGYSTGELLAAISLLEIRGLVITLPGGLYSRA